ncbi:MAG: carboxy terminal-processing peptidase [Planctomycetes bacterium]|nr:carboxy terminal-processing peptidase [Planctomycetota bacterium]
MHALRLLSSRGLGVRFLVSALVISGLIVQAARAELGAPATADRHVAQIVTSMIKLQHLSKHELDDEISERTLKGFLKMLDIEKRYFYQSDIDHFNESRDRLDDMVARGDISFAYDVFKTFLRRVDERVQFAKEFLEVEHDFTVDEEVIVDADQAVYAKNSDEAREQWRKKVKYDLLVQKADGVEKAKEKIRKRYESFAKRMHQIDGDELLEMYLTSMTSSYDPHTSFMSKRSLDNFEIQMRLNLEGIGAELRQMDGLTTIHRVVPGGAAAKAGELKAGDQIVGVGQGETGEVEDVSELKLTDVVDKIRGRAGTVVRLQVIPSGQTETKVYKITRARIELTESEARAEVKPIEGAVKPNGQPYRIGIINLPSFYMDMDGAKQGKPNYKSTTRDVREILDGFREQQIDAVILDLRQNGGGSLTEAIGLTGLFIDQGPIVQVKDSDGHVEHYDDTERGTAWDGPLVVLTSKLSASASEILAGAIQDYGRGLIVGDQATHGKGTVQSLLDLGQRIFGQNAPKLGALKITMQQFYRPSGDSTQNRGVLADVVLPSLTTHLDGISESDLDYALEFDRVPPAPFRKTNRVDRTVLDQLNRLSRARREKSEGFQKVLEQIELYQSQKSRKSVPLNEEKFLAERKRLNAQKTEEDQFEQLNNPDRPIFDLKDYYNGELVQITLDYLRLINVAQAN